MTILAGQHVTAERINNFLNPPRCKVSFTFSVPDNAITAIEFDTELKDTNDMFDLVTPDRIVFNTAGDYEGGFWVRTGGETFNRYLAHVLQNGATTLTREDMQDANAGSLGHAGPFFGTFAINDFLQLQVLQDNTDNVATDQVGELWVCRKADV